MGGKHPAGPHRLRGLEEGDGLGHEEDGASHQGQGVRVREGQSASEGVGRPQRRTSLARGGQGGRFEGPADLHPQDHRVAVEKGLARS